MNQLPEDLRQIEAHLAALSPDQPPQQLRNKALNAARLAGLTTSVSKRPADNYWLLATATAAGLFLCMNMPTSTGYTPERQDTSGDQAALRSLLPELSSQEIKCYAFRARIAQRLAPLPFVKANLNTRPRSIKGE
jgi:hypothetical protein